MVDAVGSETEDIGGKTFATDESELSMVHEGSDSSVRIEQGNIMIDFIWVCIARSMVDLVMQRNRLARARWCKTLLYRCNGLRA